MRGELGFVGNSAAVHQWYRSFCRLLQLKTVKFVVIAAGFSCPIISPPWLILGKVG